MLQDGTVAGDSIKTAAGDDDRSVVTARYTWGSYGALNAGIRDLLAVKIGSDRNTLWEWKVRVRLP